MAIYDDFDYLCNEPYFVDGIGRIKNPTLRDVRNITHRVFMWYVYMCNETLDEYLERNNLRKQYDTLPDEKKKVNTMYNLYCISEGGMLVGMLRFFLLDEFEFNDEDGKFHVFEIVNEEKHEIGTVGNENFDVFRDAVLKCLGLKKVDERPIKYKNERARKLVEKIEKAKAQMKKTSKKDDNLSLENMIRKYCTYNKVGINILNVWDMTFYQFNTMFTEYSASRQVDLNDFIAANTFSYNKSEDYKSNLWIEKLNKETN